MPNLAIVGVYIAAFGVIPAFVFWSVGRLTAWRRPVVSVTAGIMTVFILAIVIYKLPDPDISRVQIDEDHEPQVARGAWPTIEGSVTPPEARVILLVHWAQDNRWWVQAPARRGNLGAWQAEINLGTKERGAGQQFQIVAIASTNPWFIDVLKGYWLWEGGTVPRPPALPRSRVVSIWRRQ